MRNIVLQSLVVLVVVFMVGIAQAGDPYAVGEKWTYKHEGAVPMRPPDFTITGDRTREVMGVQEDKDEKRWIIQELWGSGDEWGSKRFVCAEGLFEKMEAGENRVMTAKPEYPYDLKNLKPDEEKKWESTFDSGGEWSFPIKMTAKRVKDETVKVPAGEFENCTHIVIEESVTFTPPNGDPMTITTKRDQWYSDKVNGLVKEVYTLSGPDGTTSTGTSELKAYVKEKKE